MKDNNNECPIVFVINCFNRYSVCSEFVKHFDENFGEQIVYKLPQSEVFVEASLSKVSAVEMNESSKAAQSIQELCNGIIKEIDLENEGNDAKQVKHHTKQKIIE